MIHSKFRLKLFKRAKWLVFFVFTYSKNTILLRNKKKRRVRNDLLLTRLFCTYDSYFVPLPVRETLPLGEGPGYAAGQRAFASIGFQYTPHPRRGKQCQTASNQSSCSGRRPQVTGSPGREKNPISTPSGRSLSRTCAR